MKERKRRKRPRPEAEPDDGPTAGNASAKDEGGSPRSQGPAASNSAMAPEAAGERRSTSDEGRATSDDPAVPGCEKRCCGQCVYGCPLPKGLLERTTEAGLSPVLLCANHPASPGEMRDVAPTDVCRNFRGRRPPPLRVEPPEPASPKIKHIPLTKGLYAIVDAADYEWLSKYRWYAQTGGRGGKMYACRFEGSRQISMHREIMKPPPGMVVDHIDGNGVDNRRDNMRNCTQLQNSQNSHRASGKSLFRGVFPRGAKWQAAIQHDGKPFYLGMFADEADAARARDRKAVELAGPYAFLNFPEERKLHASAAALALATAFMRLFVRRAALHRQSAPKPPAPPTNPQPPPIT